MSRKIEGTATWTWHEEAGGAWYVALEGRAVPPYLRQITVEAIVDVGSDGRVAGIEIVDALPPPPEGRVVSAAPDEAFDAWIDTLNDDVVQGEYGYEPGEFTVYPELWRPLYDEGLSPAAAFKRALDAFDRALDAFDKERSA